ncbi:hypothetical protein CLOP_g6570 [Closterium sp. NIES-67]|nr:hypothetical protein CLOP_g6570 [Closterium sp. NIES-67]
MRSAFKRYKLLKIAIGEEKMPEEGEARERWIEKSAVLFDLILQSVNKEMFEHIKDLVEADDSGPRAWKLLRDVIQPNTLPMVIVLEKELAAISMRPGDDVKPVLDKIKDTYARMAAAGSSVSQLQQCTKIISVLDNSWDNLIPTLNSQQDQWTPEWLRQQILQEDFRRRHRKYCEGLAEKYGLQDGGKPATPLPSGFTVEPCADEEVVGESDRKLFHSMVGGVRQRLQRGAVDVKSGEMLLSCYTDASFNSVKADGTSIGGYVCLLGGGAVSWRSKKQNEQAADIFTKRLAEADHWKGMKLAGMSVH